MDTFEDICVLMVIGALELGIPTGLFYLIRWIFF